MTDLTQAIAEVQIFATEYPYEAGDALSWFDATVLNAAASGEMIPKADAKLAVAEAYRKAADSLLECSVWCDSQERTDDGWRNGVTDARKHHMARIRALADTDTDTDALAEVQALRAEVERLADKVSTEPMAGF